MSQVPVLRTERLVLREWRDSDDDAFAALNADPQVMRFFPAPLDRAQTEATLQRIRAAWVRDPFGLWAVEVPGVAPFIGFIGMLRPRFEAHFTPAVEVGWRLAAAHWGRGYATEGARATLEYCFDTVGLTEIVSMTSVINLPSRRVMEKLGMTRDPADDFDHPLVPADSPVQRHVLYRLSAADYHR